ncbi:allophanate hydrolase subunit 2 family protein, partial [Streptomyces sp. SID5926]|nr:allophanate hydrolase subunit 2 family protein [Streptomyces sp. SID5926]
LFLHDHPTTWGYPVVAVVPEPALAAAAQAVAGTPVRFTLA